MAVEGLNFDEKVAEVWELLCSWLPVRVRIKRPFCLFTTNDAGYSIKTLYINCEGHVQTILLIETSSGEPGYVP
ncbi:unnamed protein product [Porites evermanni]|uniref:TLDc domain-containing protein n=1 Tax=Porites evermanni TaxID=104178 RepID=A0ABN8LFS0_9CNID|nr:unnamed protein product [Porites evermanni]